MSDKNNESKKSSLRIKAEKILRQRGIKDARLYALDLEQLIEELNIFQIELEQQNNELKQVHNSLEDSRNLYHDLFENAPTPYFTLNSDYKIINVNTAALRLLNESKNKLLETGFYKYIHPDSQDAFLFLLRKTKTPDKSEEPATAEIKLYTSDKQLRHATVYGKQCVSGKNEPSVYNISIIDRTEARKSDRELQIRNTALESAANSVIITDSSGTIEWVNKAFTRLTGFSKEEAIGKNPRDVVKSGKHPKSFFLELWRTIKQGKVWKGKVINKRKDGSTYTEEQTISPVFDEAGNIIRYIAVKSDITDKMILEKELVEAKDKAEEASRLKSAFLANISHEIRTPMNGILGFAELLNKHQLSEEKRDKYAQVIIQSGQRMLRILNDLIDISKIEAGETNLNVETFDIETLISELLTFFKPETKKRNIKLKYISQIAPENAVIQNDKTKISQIFSNLISNAIKYTDEGEVICKCSIENEQLKFSVQDTGIGIPPEIINQLFDRFRRYDKNHSKFREGVGLGLAISKAYSEILGGKIAVDSIHGKGSTFTYTMPLCEESAILNYPPQETKEVKPTDFQSEVILIAEDDDANYMYLEELFSDTNLKLLRAENGREAVDIVKNNPNIKLILMDVKMPEMNGLEATKAIKKEFPNIPVIIQTAYAFSDDKEKAMESGCDDFISKPLEQDILFSKMNLLIRS